MHVRPSGKALGATIEDIDLAQPLCDSDFRRILGALGEHGVLRFPHQKLETAEFARFGWATPPPDPGKSATFLRSRLNHSLAGAPRHRELREYYRRWLALRRSHPALGAQGKERTQCEVDPSGSVLTLTREAPDGTRVCLVANLTGAARPFAPPSADWRDILDSEDPRFGATKAFSSATTTSVPSGLRREYAMSRSATLADPTDPASTSLVREQTTVNGLTWDTTIDLQSRTRTTISPAGRVHRVTSDAQDRPLRKTLGGWRLTDEGLRMQATFTPESEDAQPAVLRFSYPRLRSQRNLDIPFRDVPLPTARPE